MESKNMTGPAPLRILRSAGMVAIMLVISCAAQAQYVISTKAGVVQFAVGKVFLSDKEVHLSEAGYIQMENGQTLRTELGFAELLLSPDVFMRLGANSSIIMNRNKLDDTQLELAQGSALIEAVEKTKQNKISIKFAECLIEIRKKGLYRLDTVSNELRVYSGEARAAGKNRKTKIKGGRMIRLDGDLKPSKFDENAMDLLHQWAALRSFTLFVDFPNARTKGNWTHISMGWMKNYDYGVSLRSEKSAAEWAQTRDAEAKMRESAAAAAARADQAMADMLRDAARAQAEAARQGKAPSP